MAFSPSLVTLADRLAQASLARRDHLIQASLRRHESASIAAGRVQHDLYRLEQEEQCIQEINHRIDAVWNAYRQVLTEALLPWTDEARGVVLARIHKVLEEDVDRLQSMARIVIATHGHGFDLFLRNAVPTMQSRIEAELDLFALRYQPSGVAVFLQLQSPRYEGPRRHWMSSLSALREDPPDLMASAREAIHAVEGLAKLLVATPTASLGDAIDLLRKAQRLDGASAKILDGLWGLCSGIPGLRHGAMIAAPLRPEQARYVVDLSEAALRYLLTLDNAA